MVDKMLHSQMPFTTGGQTINDRLTAAYHSLAGSQLGKTVCKATTEESIPPKKKHLDYLLHCTHEPNVSIPQLANMLVERTTNPNWCVVHKSLITIHNIMCYGNERFCQYLASSNANFNLGNFLDKTSMQGYDMSTHVRRYAKYISEKVYTYRMVAFDFCKVKRGKEDGFLRVMVVEKLLKTLPLLQGQIDALLECQVTQSDLTNGVINCSFLLMFRDLIRLFACYNDGIINLLEKYFELNKKQCAEGLELYKNFVDRMDKVAEFLKIAEQVGVDKGEIPDLVRAPGSLLESLEQHLATLDPNAAAAYQQKNAAGRDGRNASPPAHPPSNQFQPFSSNFRSEEENRDPFITSTKFTQQNEDVRTNIFSKDQKMLSQRNESIDLFSPNATSRTTGEQVFNMNNTKTNNAIDDLLSLGDSVGPPSSGQPPQPSSTNPFAAGFDYHPHPSSAAQPSPWSASPAPDIVVLNGKCVDLNKNYVNNNVTFKNQKKLCSEEEFDQIFGRNLFHSKNQGNYYGGPDFSSNVLNASAAYSSQYSTSSRGISPAPEEEPVGRNPFLVNNPVDVSSVDGSKQYDQQFSTDSGPDWRAGYDQENVSAGGEDRVIQHGFIARPSNAAPFNPFASSNSPAPSPLPTETHPAQTLDIGSGGHWQGAAHGHAASAVNSALGSPSNVPSPMRPFSQPISIQHGGSDHHQQQQQEPSNVYHQGGGYDAGTRFEGFMSPPAQRVASSYTPTSVFDSEIGIGGGANRGPPRPPSAPPSELQGLDPLGDFLAPQHPPTVVAAPVTMGNSGIQQPATSVAQPRRPASGKLLKGDLDSSLAAFAENLSIGKTQDNVKKPGMAMQWSGGSGTAAKPPGQQQPAPMMWNPAAPPAAAAAYGPTGVGYPAQPGWGGVPMVPGGAPMAQYAQPPMGYNPMMYPGQQPGYPLQMPMYGQQQQQQQPPRMPQQSGGGLDPFGAL